MKQLKHLLVTLFIICLTPLYGQFNNVEFYTPEAASLSRSIEYPVSPNTGIPDIRIPLHSVKMGTKTIDLELSFHTDNYLRVNQMPGSVGAGWSLSTEYQISRTINGLDDFGNGTGIGYILNGRVLNNYVGEYQNPNRSEAQKHQITKGFYDMEPDKFYYNIPGKSGAFYFQKQSDGTIRAVTVPYDGVKITCNTTGTNFTLTDTDGSVYTFDACDFSSLTSGIGGIHTTSWKCSTITSPTGVLEASFTYGTNFSYYNLDVINNSRYEIYDDMYESNNLAEEYWLKYRVDLNIAYPFWQAMGPRMLRFGGFYSDALYLGSGKSFQHIEPEDENTGGTPPNDFLNQNIKLLSVISFSGGKIMFNYNDNHILSTISIVNNESIPVTIKTINFIQSATAEHIVGHNQSSYYNRTLNSLLVGDESYTFTYGREHKGWVCQDMWGYNGALPSNDYYPESIFPSQNVILSLGNYKEAATLYFADRGYMTENGHDTVAMGYNDIYAIEDNFKLLTIKYPTGGRAEFEMGQNRFRYPFGNQDVRGAGGYRIEKISYFENATSTTSIKEKVYKYGPNEDGTGIIRREPIIDGFNNSTYIEETVPYYYWLPNGTGSGLYPYYTARKRTFYPSAIASINFDNGSAVNYYEVAEYEKNGATAGKTVYMTDQESYSPIYCSPTDPNPFEPDEWYLGLTSSIINYKYINGDYQWVQKKNFLYDIQFNDTMIYRERVVANNVPVVVNGPVDDSFYESIATQDSRCDGIKTGVIQQKGTEVYTRDNAGNTIMQKTLNYYDTPLDFLPSRTETLNSDGTYSASHTVYAKDYSSKTGFIQSMWNKNMIAVPIEKVERQNGKILSGMLNNFNTNGSLASVYELNGHIANESLFKLSNKNLGDFSSNLATNTAYNKSSYYTLSKSITKYDVFFNSVCVYDYMTGYYTTYIWSYSGQYPIAEVKNAYYTTVQTALNYTSDQFLNQLPANVNPIDIRTTLDNYFGSSTYSGSKPVLISTYYYNPLVGLKWKSDPRGVNTFYDYDSNGRLKEIYNKKNGVKSIIKAYDYHFRQ